MEASITPPSPEGTCSKSKVGHDAQDVLKQTERPSKQSVICFQLEMCVV